MMAFDFSLLRAHEVMVESDDSDWALEMSSSSNQISPVELINKEYLSSLFFEDIKNTNRLKELYQFLIDNIFKNIYDEHKKRYPKKGIVCAERNKFLRKLKIDPENSILKELDLALNKSTDAFVSGGCLIDLLKGNITISGDIDLWFFQNTDLFAFENENNKNCDALSNTSNYVLFEGLEEFSVPVQCMYQIPDFVDGWTYEQYIKTIIGKYDYRLCSIAYDGSYFWWRLGCLSDIHKNRIVVQNEKNSRNAALRLQKYSGRGYHMSNLDYIVNSLNMIKTLTDNREVFSRFILDDKFNYSEEAQALNSYEED